MKYSLVALCLALAGCSGLSLDNFENVSVKNIKQAQEFYNDCVKGVKVKVAATEGATEKAKVAAAGVKDCVDKYADVLAGVLTDDAPEKE